MGGRMGRMGQGGGGSAEPATAAGPGCPSATAPPWGSGFPLTPLPTSRWGTHAMTSLVPWPRLSSPSTNTEVLVKLCVLQVRPSSTLNLPRERAAGDTVCAQGQLPCRTQPCPRPGTRSCQAEAAGRTGRGSEQPQGQSGVPSVTGPLPSHSHRRSRQPPAPGGTHACSGDPGLRLSRS